MAVETNSDRKSAAEYRQRAEEMKHQAQRAETVYLQAIYASIADNWERLAAQMTQAERAHRKDHATQNWEKMVEAADSEETEDQPVPPLGAKPETKPYLPRA